MANGRRSPGVVLILGLVLLLAPLGVTAWWLTRPAPHGPPPGPPLDDLDVVCSGRVDAEGLAVALAPDQPGRVVRVSVSEGAAVKKGQEILAIDDTQYQLAVREAKAAALAAKVEADYAALKAGQFPEQIEVKAKQLEALRVDFEAGEKKLAQMRKQQTLTSAVSTADVEVFEAGVRKLKLAAEAAKIELDELRKFDAGLEVRAAQAKLDAAAVAVERAEAAVRDCVLRAPADGTVLRLQASVGGTLAPAAAPLPGAAPPAVVFAPAGPLVVRAELEQGSLGRVAAGMRAVVTDDTRTDSPTWTGRVKSIAGWVAPRRSILLEPGELNDVRTTEVVIALDPSPHPLRIGQRMQVRLARGD
jgi:multidrug resistance efflux pump